MQNLGTNYNEPIEFGSSVHGYKHSKCDSETLTVVFYVYPV